MRGIGLKWRFADVAVLFVCLGVAGLPLVGPGGGRPGSVIIESSGRVWRYGLPAKRLVEIAALQGRFTVRIDGFDVAIVETHCPDGVCRHMGPIGSVGQTMVCVPQKIEVRIVGGESGVDAICR